MPFLKHLCLLAILAVVLALSVSVGHSTDRIWHKHIGGVKYEDVQTQSKAPTTTSTGTTGLTAKGTLGGGTGPTKPTPPTTGGRHQ
jgi:hypothetical protein